MSKGFRRSDCIVVIDRLLKYSSKQYRFDKYVGEMLYATMLDGCLHSLSNGFTAFVFVYMIFVYLIFVHLVSFTQLKHSTYLQI